MAYDYTKPTNSEFLADFPPEMREQLRAIIEDAIVDSGLLNGLKSGNLAGNIPVSNGTLNVNLNADMLDGNDSTAFANASHDHNTATTIKNGFMINTDKIKIDTVATGAEVNQMAFSNIVVGSSTIQADGKTDTLEIAAGTNIALTPDITNDKITIAISGKVASAVTADTAATCYGNAATATTATICTGNAATATNSNNANTVASLSVASGQNNVSNQVVRTDGSGYLQTGYINSNNGDEGNNSSPARVWGTNGSDSYLRTYLASALNAGSVNGHVFNWSGQGGQPSWLWGGNDASNMYVYNPSNFNVNSVGGYTAAALLAAAGGIVSSSLGTNGYIKFSNGVMLQWGSLVLADDNAVGAWNNGNHIITFPWEFSNSVFVFIESSRNGDNNSDVDDFWWQPFTYYVSVSSIKVRFGDGASGTSKHGKTYSYIMLGN